MNDPFESAASYNLEVDPLGSGTIRIEKMNGESHHYDKVDFITIDREPFFIGLRATEEDAFVPVGTFPAVNVQMVEASNSETEFKTDY